MSSHLNDDQLAGFLAGNTGWRETAHLDTCPACFRAVAEMRESLTSLGSAVTAWSEDHAQFRAPPARQIRRGPARAALAITVVLALILLAVYPRPARKPRLAAADPDTLLLRQIDSALSQQQPSHMQPLLQLLPREGIAE